MDAISNQKLSFSPDSPLFAKRIDQYGADLEKLGDFLKTMVAQMRQFCKDIKHGADSAFNLGVTMKCGPNCSELNTQLIPVIKRFGEIFTEISNSQSILADSLENAFVAPLEVFYSNEVNRVQAMKQHYFNQRDILDSTIERYIRSDVSGSFGHKMTQNQLDYRAHEVVQQKKRLEITRFDLVRKVNEIEARKSFELAECCVASVLSFNVHYHECMEILQNSKGYMDDLHARQQHERENYSKMLGPVERRRGELMNVLESMENRVKSQSPFLQTYPVQSTGGGQFDETYETILPPPPPQHSSLSPANGKSRFGKLGDLMSGLSRQNQSGVKGDPVSKSLHGHDDLSTTSSSSTATAVGSFEETELRLKALECADLSTLYSFNQEEEPMGVVLQGYLWKKSKDHKVRQHWNRRWFVLDGSKIYYLKEGGVCLVCDVLLTTVKELKSFETPFCFDIVHANIRTTTVQAEGIGDYNRWISAIRGGIERMLITGGIGPSISLSGKVIKGVSVPMKADSLETTQKRQQAVSRRKENNARVAVITAANPYCAECGRVEPEWVSINLGCLICISCSGVHRSLGVHISKVRSLTLDELEVEEYNLLDLMGNELSNSIWEAAILEKGEGAKLKATDADAARYKYILAKYHEKLFLTPVDDTDFNSLLFAAASSGDVRGVLRAIVYGANISGLHNGQTALHIAAQAGSTTCCTLLMSHGADSNAVNDNGQSATEVASTSGFDELAAYLSRRMLLQSHMTGLKPAIGSPISEGVSHLQGLSHHVHGFDDDESDSDDGYSDGVASPSSPVGGKTLVTEAQGPGSKILNVLRMGAAVVGPAVSSNSSGSHTSSSGSTSQQKGDTYYQPWSK